MTTAHRRIVRIVAIYAAFAAAWILLSDKVLEGVVEDPALRTHVSIAKGWAFVAVTSGLLYALMRRAWRLTEEAIAQRLESLSLLETIANGVDDAVFAKDTAGRYLLFNQAAARFVGKTVPEVLGQDDRALFPPEQAGMLMELGVRVMREGVTRTREEILSLPDGSTRVFLATKGPLRSPDGRLLGIFGISRDITAQKAALAALQASEERLHLFIERAPAALAMFDRNMVYLAASRRWIDDYGLGDDTVVGRSHYELLPEIPERWHEAHRRGLAGEIVRVDEDRFDRLDGRTQWLRWEILPWHQADGVGGIVIFSEDITARKQAAEALRRSEQRYRDMFEDSPHPMWVFDLDSLAFLAVNDAAVAHYGYRRDEFLTRSLRDMLAPEDLPALGDAIEQIAAGHYRPSVWTHVRKDGSRIQVEMSVRELEFDGHRAATVIAHDMTRRLEAEAALRKLSQVVEQSPDSIVITNAAGRIEYVNDAFLHSSGRTRDTTVGQHARILKSGLTPDTTYAALRTAMAAGQAWKGEFVSRHCDGTEYVELALITPIRQPDGTVSHFVAIKEDITEKRRLGAELERYRHHLEELVAERTSALRATTAKLLDTQFAMDSVGIGIHWVDADSGRFTYVNRFSAGLLGYTEQEMLQLSVPDVDPHFPPDAYRAIAERIRREGRIQIETAERHKDGHPVPVELTIYHLAGREGGERGRFIVFLTEITRRKEAEAALHLAKSAAVAANQAKSAFLANMSHEIRTPMNAILGFTRLLQRSPLSAEQTEQVDKIGAAGEHLLSIINDVLDLSKIEADKLHLEETDFPASALLDGVRSLIGELAQTKGLEVTIDYGNLPTYLRGDPTRLRQALLNYASNAIKFTARGSIHLAAHVLVEEGDALLVRFEVRDSGVGIAPEKLGQLFQAFSQVDSSTTRRFGGTGLGLAITHRLAGLMGGETGVDSTPGQGSLFWFTARLKRGRPVAEALRTRTPEDAEVQLRARHAGARILLVEDDAINQEVALSLLADTGLVVDVAENGARAVAMAGAAPYELILMDMQMPVMDGLAATRALRAQPAMQQTPIIAMTANAFAEDRRHCLAVGMNDFLPKPVEPDALFGMLLRWLPDGDGSQGTR